MTTLREAARSPALAKGLQGRLSSRRRSCCAAYPECRHGGRQSASEHTLPSVQPAGADEEGERPLPKNGRADMPYCEGRQALPQRLPGGPRTCPCCLRRQGQIGKNRRFTLSYRPGAVLRVGPIALYRREGRAAHGGPHSSAGRPLLFMLQEAETAGQPRLSSRPRRRPLSPSRRGS